MAEAYNADRNLLFGILAVQMDFISRDALVAAMHAWILQKAVPLGEILQSQGHLTSDRKALLDALVSEHLKQHDQDPEKSLAAVSSVGSLRDDLRQLADPELEVSLAHLSIQPRETDPYATAQWSIGASSSTGMRFRVLRPHARGGLGEVYVAHDEELHREVALKEIQERHAHDANSRARFLLEAEITGGLEHPGIVPVYGLGSYADGRPFYAMRFIKGDSLKEAIERFHASRQGTPTGAPPGDRRRRPRSRFKRRRAAREDATSFGSFRFRKLLGRFVDVCNAIGYAHSRGVLHRDLKPGNVMLGKYGETLVVDWGLAKVIARPEVHLADDERTLQPTSGSGAERTQLGSAIGTPQYMSPEQAEGRLNELGPASDVYSLGATFYTLLTGRAPFADADLGVMLQQVSRGEFPAPRQVVREVPRSLEAICLKAMALRPNDRYASPRALANDIEHWLADEPVSARPDSIPARVGRWGRRHQTLVAAVFAILLTGGSTLGILQRLHSEVLADNARLAWMQGFEGELDREVWSAGHVAQLDKILEKLQLLSSSDALQARERFRKRFADAIRKMLGKERFDEPDFGRVKDAIDLFSARWPGAELDLKRLLNARFTESEAFEIAAPFEHLSKVFGDRLVAQGGAIGSPATGERRSVLVPTLVTCPGDAELEAVFTEGTWEQARALQLVLNYNQWHAQPVGCFCVAPGGKTLATGSADGDIKIWDVATRQLVATLTGHAGAVTALAWASDGAQLASAGDDGTVQLWAGDDWHGTVLYRGMPGALRVLAFAPDAQTLAAGHQNGTVTIWNPLAANESRKFEAHEGAVLAMAFSGEGPTLITSSEDATIRLWDVRTFEPLGALEGHQGPATALAVSADGKQALTGGKDGTVRNWDLGHRDEQRVFRVSGKSMIAVGYVGDGSTVAAASDDGDIRLWDSSGALRATLTIQPVRLLALQGTFSGKLFTLGNGVIYTWDVATGQREESFGPTGYSFTVTSVPLLDVIVGAEQPAPRSLGQLIGEAEQPVLQIIRNGLVLREQPVALTKGKLRLSAVRERERLTFQINNSPPLIINDVFPLQRSDAAVFGVLWPDGLQAERVSFSRKPRHLSESPLEKGDDLYERGQYLLAKNYFRAQARRTDSAALLQECQCKEALCLVRLNQLDEARPKLELLAREDGSRWPVVAACQLWLLQLDRKQFEETNAILAKLAPLGAEELAQNVPYDVLWRIMRAHWYVATYDLVQFAPDRLRTHERQLAVLELLRAPPLARWNAMFNLMQVYHYEGKLGAAIAMGEKLVQDPRFSSENRVKALIELAWPMCQAGRAQDALDLLDRWLVVKPGTYAEDYLSTLPMRACVLHALGQVERADESLRYFFQRADPNDSQFDTACLTAGFLREEAGDELGAQGFWERGYRHASGTNAMAKLDVSVMASLTGLLTDEDALLMIEGNLSVMSASNPFSPLFKILLLRVHELTPAFRDLYRSPRGREYARRIAFRSTSSREHYGVQMRLFAYECCHHLAFPDDVSPEHDEVMWDMVSNLHESYNQGKVPHTTVAMLCLTGVGTFNGFQEGQSCDQSFRATAAYIFGHRYRYLNRLKESARFFRIAVQNAAPDSLVHRLASAQLRGSVSE